MKTKRRNTKQRNTKRRNTKRYFLNQYKGGGKITYAEILEIFHKFLDDGILGKEGSGIEGGFGRVYFFLTLGKINDLVSKNLNISVTVDKLMVIDEKFCESNKYKELRKELRESILEIFKYFQKNYFDQLIEKLNILEEVHTEFFEIKGQKKFKNKIHIDEIIIKSYEFIKSIKTILEKLELLDRDLIFGSLALTTELLKILGGLRPFIDSLLFLIKTDISFVEGKFVNTRLLHECEKKCKFIIETIFGIKILEKMNIRFKTNLNNELYIKKQIHILETHQGKENQYYQSAAYVPFWEDRNKRELEKIEEKRLREEALLGPIRFAKGSEKRPTKPLYKNQYIQEREEGEEGEGEEGEGEEEGEEEGAEEGEGEEGKEEDNAPIVIEGKLVTRS